MKLMLVLYLLSLSITASCTEAPLPDEGALVLTAIRDHDKEIGKTTGTVLGQDADSIRYITLSLDNREVQIRIVPDERERWKVPCTYVLDNGEVIHHNCEGLYHTPHKGKGRWKISEVRAGLIHIERYRDSTSYRPGPFMPEVVLGKELMPYRLEYYSADYSRHVRTVELYASNTYTPDKLPKIEVEQTFEAEHGFAPPDDQEETAYLWTWSWVQFFDSGHTGVSWRLQRYNAGRGLQGFTTTVSILDEEGEEIYKMHDVEEDIIPALVTPDGRYLGVLLNNHIDINAYPNRLGLPGIRIYDMTTGQVDYEDIGELCSSPHFDNNSSLIFYTKRIKVNNATKNMYTLLNMESRIMYQRSFTKEEERDISLGAISWATSWEAIIEKYPFKLVKFK